MKKPLAVLGVVGISTLLTACPPPQFPGWRDTTGTERQEDQWEQDYGACSGVNPDFSDKAPKDVRLAAIREFISCMSAHGWERKTESSN